MCWELPSPIFSSPRHALIPTLPKAFSLTPALLASQQGMTQAWSGKPPPHPKDCMHWAGAPLIPWRARQG